MAEFIFRCFASGSSGNCYYLGNRREGILIDAGISARTIRSNLFEMGLDFRNIMGVLVTHDHADHIRAVGTIGERFHVPIYATRDIHAGIDHNYGVQEKLRTSRKFYEKGEPFQLCGMTVNTFTISHDSTDCVSYVIDYEGQRFMIATDVGCVDETLEQYVETANHLVVEANHDEQLLLNGPYPSYLKSRILSDRGHMSNHTCGLLLSEHHNPGLKNIFLCHLSKENNDPEVALDTVSGYLRGIGVEPGRDVNLVALERLTPSPVYDLLNNTSSTPGMLNFQTP
ncbi:MAG: MBL fold metallo-hydrolase [Paludibacteraceae bacterium]|nr:MBL fold metallo-hydrolase [Paludibacteraceae bacterium]MBQ9705173.1 MBL fold metallo-hydrolase [Paludibacteraceae bacterium]